MVGHTKVPDLEDAFFAMVPEDLTSQYDALSAHPSPQETGRQLSSYEATMAVPNEKRKHCNGSTGVSALAIRRRALMRCSMGDQLDPLIVESLYRVSAFRRVPVAIRAETERALTSDARAERLQDYPRTPRPTEIAGLTR